jgi:hypothetical protein
MNISSTLKFTFRYILIAGLCLVNACKPDSVNITSREGSVSASEALVTFRLEPGFKMELLASEPLIAIVLSTVG